MRFKTKRSVVRPGTGFVHLSLFLLSVFTYSFGQREIEITSFYAKVYVAPSTNANFIGLTQKGERYPILGIRDSWYHIKFKNANGWVENSQVTVIDPAAVVAQQAEVEAVATVDSAAVPVPATPEAAPVTGFAAPPATASRPEQAARQTMDTNSQGNAESARRAPVRQTNRQSRASAQTTQQRTEKKESVMRSWFTQQNLPELPTALVPEDGQAQKTLYFEVRYPARVLEFLSPEAPILGMAKRGQVLPLVSEGDSWCRVAFADTIGWIENKHGRIYDPDAQAPIDYVKIVVLAGIFALLCGVAATLYILLKRRGSRMIDTSSVDKHVLIIAQSPKTIQYTLTNGTTTLERCFIEVGFTITFAREIPEIKNYLLQTRPDVVLADYQSNPDIISTLERYCLSAASALFIVYNVPDPAQTNAGNVLPKMEFLGTSFSDRDLFKLVTPTLRHDAENIQKSVQSSALAGNIADGNLLEVLQFIEIGSKTGCLLVELERPYAIICFKNGRIIFSATADKIIGRDAIFKVLDLKSGRFRFVLDKKPKESNVNLSTLEVLMEWTKAVDEANSN